MNKKEILIILLIICAIFSLQAVAASDDVNGTDNVVLTTGNVSAYALPDLDNQLQDGSVNVGTFSDLQNDLSSGGSITLERNYTYSDSDSLAEGIAVPTTVTKIDGQGKVIIDANKQARVFNIASGHAVTLTGITFINGNANGNGGSINSNGVLTLIDCTFANNTASGHGGAVYLGVSSGDTVTDSKFTGNVAGLNGGAIDWRLGSSNGKVSGSIFENNTAERSGGAIHWSGHYGTISNSNFTNNKANGTCSTVIGGVVGGGDGGAVLWVGSHGIIKDNCIFADNYAKNRGGAVFLHGNSTENCTNTTITKSVFKNNIAGVNGGAVDWQKGAHDGILSYSTFINNTAKRSGGAVFWNGHNGTINYCSFDDNHALGENKNKTFPFDIYQSDGGDGGAVIWTGDIGKVSYSNFTNNTAAVLGGAVYLQGSTTSICKNTTFDTCRFINNSAQSNGGAIDWYRGAENGKVLTSVFINNTAGRSGGAIHWSGHYGIISNTNFTGNRALGTCSTVIGGVLGGGDGGAVLWVGSNGTIKDNCIFTDNFAKYRGGAVFLHGNDTENCDNTTIDHAVFRNNVAGLNGGAIDWQKGATNGTVSYSRFINNTAWRSGGAIYWNGINGSVKYCEFTDNDAVGNVTGTNFPFAQYQTEGGNGGAIIWTGTIGNVIRSNFTNNSAAKWGGAVYLQGYDDAACENTTFDGCNFIGNDAGVNGGAIDWHEGAHNGNVYNSTFTENTAGSNGGAIFWNGHHGEIRDSNFTKNTAKGLLKDAHGNIGDGGAIIWSGINGTVENCRFIDNEAKFNDAYTYGGRGGAVYLQNCTHGNCENTTFRNMYFKNNTAGTNGGAIDWHAGAHDGVLNNGTFINNTAKRSGGAIFWNGHNGTIKYSKFYSNRALGQVEAVNVRGVMTSGGDGGAIMWSGALGNVFSTNFVNNTAAKRGGAVFLQGSETEDCYNTTFKKSYFANNVAGSNGGAIDWFEGAHNGIVDNVTFINNTAKRNGGAIFWHGENGTVKNSRFNNNRATGEALQYDMTLIMPDDIVLIQDSKLPTDTPTEADAGKLYVLNYTNEGNYAFKSFVADRQDDGTYVWLQLDETEVTTSTISPVDWAIDQFFGGDGGTILWSGDIGLVENCSFVNSNSARRGGGAYMTGSDYVTYKNCNFTKCTSGTNGGGVDWLAGANYGKIYNCIFNETRAARSAGAIYYDGWYGEMKNITIINTKAWGGSLKQSDDGLVRYAGWDSSHWDTNTTGGDAGAIMFTGNHELLHNVTFINCTATGRGGAVFLQDNDNVTFDFCTFKNNRALGIANNTWNNDKNLSSGRNILHTGNGGAIGFDVGANDGYVYNSKFINNTAERNGGAISFYTGSSGGHIFNSTFINNTAKRSGGAFFWDGTNGTISYCNFTNNSALGTSLEYDMILTYDNIVVAQNILPEASASTMDKLYIVDSSTGKNNISYASYVAEYDGSKYVWLLLDETHIVNDTAPSPTDWGMDQFFGGNGGTILWGGNVGTIDHCNIFNSNSARRGGGAYMRGSDNITFSNCNFTNDTSGTNGGALDWLAGANYGKVINCTFEDNRAARSAGTIYYDGDYGQFTNITIKDSYANGGALKTSADGRVKYAGWDSSHWDTNTTGGDAGAIMITGNHVYVYNATFTNCTAVGRGGAVFLQDNDNVTFELCTFENNRALGTANNTWDDDKDVTSGLNEWNTGHGGAIGFDMGATMGVIKDSKFINNTAARDGGAISFAFGSSNATIYNSTFTNNTAKRNGGAFAWNGNNGNISYCNFTGNKALGTAIDTDHITFNSLSQVHNVTKLPSASSSTLNKLYVLVTYNGYDKVKYELYVTVPSDDENEYRWLKHIETNETDPSPTDWAVDEYFGGDGGSIVWGGDHGIVDHCIFIDSDSARRGGGAYMKGSDNVTFSNCYFENDTSGTNGGGLDWLAGANYGKVINSTFNNTRAARSAGAIYYDGDYGQMTNITIINATANGGSLKQSRDGKVKYAGWDSSHWDTNTTGGDAGAIMFTGDHINVYNATFINCTAVGRGGAVFLQDNHNVTFELCTFEENSALGTANNTWTNIKEERDDTLADNKVDRTYTGHGGAIAFDTGASDGYVINSKFNANHAARDGGAIYYAAGATRGIVINSTFTNHTINYDGGAIYLNGTYCEIHNSTFLNNSAKDDGGAIFWQGNHGTIYNITCDYNHGVGTGVGGTSSTKGGVICLTGSDIAVDKSTFTNSYGGLLGGTIFVTGNDVNITNSEFKNSTIGMADGGALYILGNNTLIKNCTFDNCTSPNNGGTIYVLGDNANLNIASITHSTAVNGGAIYISGQNATVNNTSFDKINASEDGGVIYISGDGGKLYNSNFTNNFAGDDGGAIFWEGDYGTIENIMCYNNTAVSKYVDDDGKISSSRGGAISLVGSDITISKSNFTLNSAIYNEGANLSKIDGGALFITGDNINITDTVFTQNGAAHYGGTIYILGHNDTVSNCSIENTKAINGGAIFVEGDNATISADFKNTNATLSGGSIFVQGFNATIINSTFDDTHAFGSTSNGGGAIFIQGDFAHVIKSDFTNNYANSNSHAIGGAIYVTGHNVGVSESTFKNSKSNLHGGAIYIDGQNTTIENSNFTECSVDSSGSTGGAIYVNGINANISGSNFIKSSAVDEGGAIYVNGLNATISTSNFENNKVNGAGGGAIYIKGNYAIVDKSNFTKNDANVKNDAKGGAIYVSGDFAEINGSNFKESTTKSSGGFIYIDGKNASLIGSTFYKAVAGSSGGAIYINKENALIEDCVVNNSDATGQSGAVHLKGANARVIGSSFNNNHATSQGGAMYVAGGGAKVINSSFTSNVANSEGGAIYWSGGHDEDQIVGSNFTDNKGFSGGAIYWQKSNVYKKGNALIKDSIFKGNTATGGSKHGGAILIFTSELAIVENCTFIKNTVKSGDGGAMYVGDSGGGGANLIINSSRFINNSAAYGGGAVSSQYKNTEFINSNFTGNYANFGGAIVMKNKAHSQSATIDNCLFTDSSGIKIPSDSNKWGEGGGAIYMLINNVVVSNSTFINCTAIAKGGAINWAGENGKLYNCTFENCSSPNGGAVYWGYSSTSGGTGDGTNGNLTNSTFINCHSTGNGGAIVLNAGDSTKEVSDLRIFNCSASDKGGAIYVSGKNVPLSDSRIINCSAVNGGALYWDYDGGSIENITIANSSATSNGGGIYWNKAGGSIKDITLINNTAKLGGGLYNKYTGTINHANFTLNKAEKGSAIYSEVALNLKDTSLLKNRANNATLTMTSKDDIRTTGKVILTFKGWDNQLNALMVTESKSVSCNNVTYWNELGKVNTGVQTFSGKSAQAQLESGQNFTVKIYDENGNQLNAGEDTYLTDANGKIDIALSKYTSSYNGVYVDAYLTNEDYYTYVEISTRAELDLFNASTRNATFHMNATMFVNVTADATGNVSVYYNGTFLGNITLGADGKGSSDKILTLINDKFLEVGSYTIDFIYMGDNNYKTANTTAVLNITKAPSDIIFNITELGYDLLINVTVVHDITGIVTDPNDVTGNVTLVIATPNGHSQTVTAYLENGTGIAYAIDMPMEEDISISAKYNGDDNYLTSTNSTSYRLKDKIKSSIDIKVNVFDIYVNETIIINVTVNTADGSDAPGNVTLILDNVEYNLTLNNSKASFTKTGLTAGHKIVTASYEGSDELLPSSNNAKFNVHKYNATLVINTTNITRGDVEMVNITVPDDAEGIVNVTITGDGYLYHHLLEIENGKVIIPLYNLKIGVYNVTASFEDGKYKFTLNSTLFNVSKTVPVIDIHVENVTYGNDTVITVTVPNGATGNVTLKINDTIVVFEEEILEAGQAEFTVRNLPAGNYTIHVDYFGDVNNTFSSGELNFTVYKADPVITVTVEDIWYGQVEHITVTVNARGTVKIRVNGTEREIVLADDGSAVIHLLKATKEFVFDTLDGKADEYVYNLAVGKYPVEVIYSGNENYNGMTVNRQFTVSQIATNFDLEVHDITVWEREYINVTGFVNETGEVILNINGVNHTAEIKEGVARFNTTDLHVGENTVCAYYPGDRNYTGGHITKTFNVAQRTPDISVVVSNITVGHRVKITVYIPENATGYVVISGNFTENLIYMDASDFVEGNDEIFVHNLSYGRYSLHIKYYGDENDNYAIAENDTVFKVSKNNATGISVSAENITYGQKATIEVDVPADIEGTITLTLNDTANTHITLPIYNHKVTWTVDNLASGNYTVNVTYNGNDKYNVNNTLSKKFEVAKVKSVLEIDVPEVVDVATNATVTVRINQTATGNITLTVNGTKYNTTIENGVATFTIDKLLSGKYDITAEYIGDGNNSAAATVTLAEGLEITKVSCYQINVTASDTKVGINSTIVVNVPKDATGTVVVWVNGTKLTNSTIVDGVATVSINKTLSGKYVVNATLIDDKYDNKTVYTAYWVSKVETPMEITVVNRDNIKAGDNVTVVVNLPGDIKNEVVTIEINGERYSNTTVNNIATFNVPSVAYGNKTVTATYGGNNKYVFNSTTANFTVNKRNSYVNVTPVGNSVGNNATITVKVPANATGYVTVNVNGNNYTIRLNGAGEGSVEIAGLGNGTYYVHATYLGDDQYNPSENNTGIFVMNKLDATGIQINVDNIFYGQNANITVTVPSGITGTVTLKLNDTANSEITLTIVDGKVNWIVENLKAGNYTVNVTYNGNAQYNINDTVSDKFEVKKATPIIIVYPPKSVNGGNAVVGERAEIVIQVNGKIDGETVTITGLDKDYAGTIEYVLSSQQAIVRITTDGSLEYRQYTIRVNYAGNENYTNAVGSLNNFTPAKVTDYKLNITSGDIKVDDLTNITVNVPNDAEGIVKVEINGTNYTVTIRGGKAVFHNQTNLPVGKYNITAYFGNDKYANKTATGVFYISKVNATVTIDADDIAVGDVAYINVTAPSDNVTIEINGKSYTRVKYENGVAYFEVPALEYGDKTVTAVYGGSDKYVRNTTTESFKVSKRNTSINITVSDTTYGDKVNIKVNVTDEASGFITIRINDTRNVTLPITNGKVTWIVEDLGVENYTVYANYSGNAKYNVTSTDKGFKVTEATPVIVIGSVTSDANTNATVTVRINATASGKLNITVDGKNYTADIVNGVATFTVDKLSVNEYDIKATYAGDDNYTNKSQTLVKGLTVTKVDSYLMNASANDTQVGSNTTIVVNVPADATGKVVIYVNGTFAGNATITQGVAKLNVTKYIEGRYVVNATLTDNKYANQSVTTNYYVSKVKTPIDIGVDSILVGADAIITVTVPGDVSGNVTIEIDGRKLNKSVDSNGQAVFTVEDLTNGTKTVTASYAGDDKYMFNATTKQFNVSKHNTTINITVSDITYGGKVNITVNVTDGAFGVITIRINDTRNVTLPISNGKVTWIVEGLGVENYTVYADYSGDAKYNANSTDKGFKVTKAVPVIVIESATVDTNTNATVTVTINNTVSGKLNITVEGKNYTADIVNGVAVFTVDKLPAGEYNITANYTGDDNYSGKVETLVKGQSVTKVAEYLMNASANDTKVGFNTTVVVNVPADATGKVVIYVNGTFAGNATISQGVAKLNVTKDKEGRYVVNATLADAKYANQTVETSYYVSRLNIPITVTVINRTSIYVGDTVKVVVTVHEDVTENVTIEINGISKTNVTVRGNATFHIPAITYGNKTVVAAYVGDDKYVFNSTTANFTVNKRSSFVKVNVTNTTVGSGAFINVTVPSNATGHVIVTVNGTDYTINLTGGKGNVTVYGLENNTYDVIVTYLGDDQYMSSDNAAKLGIDKLTTSFEVRGTNITVGSAELITFETPDSITGQVNVEINSRNYTAFVKDGRGNLTVYGLSAGKYNVTVHFEGNGKYEPASSAKENFTVAQTTAGIVIVPQNITYGESETVIIYIDATGTVNVTVDTYEIKNKQIDDGKVIIEVPGFLTAGNYTVFVDYSGNVNCTNSSAEENFTVAKADPVMTVEVQNITYGGTEHITVTVKASGNVTIKVDGRQKTIVLKNGQTVRDVLRAIIGQLPQFEGKAILDVEDLPVGEYPVEVTYNGNENYNAKTVKTVFFVTKDNITVDVQVENIRVDGKEVINVTLNNTDATGKVIINVDGRNYTRDLSQGRANLTLDKLSNSTHSVVVIYEGDSNFNGNWTSATFNVSKVKPEISVEVENRSVGQTERIVVHLPENATGYVVIDVDGTKHYVDIVKGTETTLTVDNLENKTYTVDVIYSGDGYYETASDSDSFNISKVKSNIAVKVENITLGDVAAVNVTVITGATGNVTVTIGDEFNMTVGITDGEISVIVPGLSVGDKTVNVTYNGNEKYLPSRNSTTFSVGKINSTAFIEIIDNGNGTVTVIVPENATGNVTIYVDGKNFTGNVSDGIAIVTLNDTVPGKHNITAVYSGDENYAGASVKGNVTIPKLAAPIHVNVSDIYVGDVAYINITAPSNNVTVEINGKKYEPVSYSNGIARFAVENLAYGNKTVAVTYAGNANYTENFTTANFTVNKRNSYVKVNVSDINVGDTEIINVTVPGNASGFVVVNINGTNYTVNITGGEGSLPIVKLANGTYNIVATYLGDGQYMTSTNGTQTFTVSKVPSKISVTVSHEGIIANGSDVNITVHAPGDATGKVNVTVSDGIKNTTYTIYVNDGTGVLHIETPEIGIYNVTAEYLGDDKYVGSENRSEFEVYPTGKALAVDTEPVTVADQETVLVFVSGNHTGDEVKIIVRDSNGNIVKEKNTTFTSYYEDLLNATSARLKLDTLPAGEYSVEAIYLEKNGTKVIEHTGTGSFKVSRLDSDLTIREIRNVTVGENVTIELVISPDAASGNISVFVNGVEYKTTTENLTITVSDLPAEEYIVHAFYYGDGSYNGSNASSVFKVSKKSAPITINVTNSKVGETEQIKVTLPNDAEGRVLLDIGDNHYYADIVNGTATFNISKLDAGKYNVTATYEGSGKYLTNRTDSSFQVTETVPEIAIKANNITVGEKVLIEVTTPEDVTMPVLIDVDGVGYYVNITGGKGQLEVPYLADGKYNVTARYLGDTKYGEAQSIASFKVSKVLSTVNVTVENITVGDKAVINVETPKDLCGNVTVSVDGENYTVFVSGGKGTLVVSGLDAGPHNVDVIFDGCRKYEPSANTATFNVNKIDLDDNDVKVIDQANGTVVIAVPSDATGNVTIKVGDREYSAEVVNGTAIVNLENETPGVHDIEIIYSGNDKYDSKTVNGKVTSSKSDVPIKVEAQNSLVGDSAVITVTVPEDATGNVTIEVDGVKHTAEIKDGKAVFEIENLTAGTKTVAVDYAGDDKHVANHTTGKITVSKCPSSINATVTDIDVGDDVIITVNVPSDATGQVLIDIDGVGYYVNVTGGKAVAKIPRIPNGVYDVNITYAGDDKYLSSSNKGMFNVSKIPSFVIPHAQDITVGENEVITLTVPSDATGTVTVIVDGEEYDFNLGDGTLSAASGSKNKYSVAVNGGDGELTISNLPKGEYVVSVRYDGDSKYLPSSNSTVFTVSKQTTDLDVEDLGNGTVIVHTPKDATGTVKIKVDNEDYTAEVINGTAVINMVNTTPGTKSIEVIYSGDGNYAGKTVNTTANIPKYPTPISVEVSDIKVGETAVITVTVPDNAEGTVTIEIDAVKYTAEVKDGKAVFNVEGLKEGNKTVAVRFDDGDWYEWNSTTAQFEVSKLPSEVSAKPKDIKVGADEVITITLPSDATGKVLVEIGGVKYYADVINGKAKLCIPGLPAGKYTAKVTYVGDDKYAQSEEVEVKFTVSKTKAPISAKGDIVVAGDDSSVTVKLPNDATGVVTITVEGKTYSADVINGKAVFIIPNLPSGKYDVKVSYSGDNKYAANTTVTDIIIEDNGHNNNVPSYNASSKEGISLSVHTTGNPIWILLLIILAVGSTQIRRFRK